MWKYGNGDYLKNKRKILIKDVIEKTNNAVK